MDGVIILLIAIPAAVAILTATDTPGYVMLTVTSIHPPVL